MRPLLVAITLGLVLSTALLHAQGVTALVTPILAPSPREEGGGAEPAPRAHAPGSPARSAASILSRNPFGHDAVGLDARAEADAASADALPPCRAVRAVFTIRGEDEDGSLAALDLDGRRIVRARGGDVGERILLRVGFDRVLLGTRGSGDVCVAQVFAPGDAPPPTATAPRGAANASPLARSIVRVSPTETHVDGSALEELERAVSSGKLRASPERDGDRILGLRLGRVDPGSLPDLLGLVTADRIEAIAGVELDDTHALLAGWARLRAAREGRIPVRIQRGGKAVQLDLVVR
jgi:hypothetical protein